MGKKITKRPNPFEASVNCLLAVTFPKSTSKSYPLAVNIAQGAAHYEEIVIKDKLVHFVSFAKSRADAGRAKALIRYIAGWKGVQVFAEGKLTQNTWQVIEVLDCYISACGCTDWKAHCFTVIDDPFIDEPEDQSMSFSISFEEQPKLKQAEIIGRFVFPCRHLHSHFKFQKDHPSTPEAQIQAGAVRMGCDWCPKFNADLYEKVGTRTIIKDFLE